MRKVWGGVYIGNIGSIFNFKKLGFSQEGKQRDHGLVDGKPMDNLIFGILNEEWTIKRESIDY